MTSTSKIINPFRKRLRKTIKGRELSHAHGLAESK
jgi:hypothetical protein